MAVCRSLAFAWVVALLVGGYRYVWPFAYRPVVVSQAQRYGLDPFLVAAVIRVESRFQPNARSRRGAIGLMQLLPTTAQWIEQQTGQPGLSARLTDPAVNVALGSWYLTYLLKRFGHNWVLALAAYNAGPATVRRWLKHGQLGHPAGQVAAIPYPETRAFVRRVLLFRTVYRYAYYWLGFRPHWVSGVVSMAKVMSEETKMKLSQRLGVAELVRQEGWGAVPSRQCGNLVREAIRLAEEELARMS
jgi:soluble lytic murein transglycosylase